MFFVTSRLIWHYSESFLSFGMYLSSHLFSKKGNFSRARSLTATNAIAWSGSTLRSNKSAFQIKSKKKQLIFTCATSEMKYLFQIKKKRTKQRIEQRNEIRLILIINLTNIYISFLTRYCIIFCNSIYCINLFYGQSKIY